MTTIIEAWHIGGLRLGYSDQRPIVYGQWMTADGPPVLCRSGFHASVNIFDALENSTGGIIRRVELRGDVVTGTDKIAARDRRHLWRVKDSDGLFRAFSRWAALQVADRWECPDIVRRWLETGDESIQSAARSAAWSASRSAARSAAWSAAWYAAWYAAEDAAKYAAKYAAESTAEAAQRTKLLEMIEAAEKVTTDEEPTT